MLGVEEMELILTEVQNHFILSDNIEFTLEANPDDLTKAKLSDIKKLGINRLSIGIQTFDDRFLTYFNRAHDSEMAANCVPKAREAGFENISVDLIFGIPNQTLDELKRDLERIIQLKPDHVSIYGLTIEPKTTFGNWQKKGNLKPIDEELAAQQFELIMAFLKEKGFEQYEISNFAKPGFKSKHNSSYWIGKKYLGLGPSAHSFNGISRQFNVRNNVLYTQSLENGLVPATIEPQSYEDRVNDVILTRLRTSAGLDLDWLEKEFDLSLRNQKSKEISQLLEGGVIQIEEEILRLSDSGKLLADMITEKLFVQLS